jgi:HD superfamily phosphodiesterase
MMDLREQLRAHLRENAPNDSAHDIGHADRVWRNAQLIALEEPPCNPNVLIAAC